MIVVVAKQPDPGSVKTRLCPPLTPSQAASLAERFLHDSVRLAARSGAGDVAIGFSPAEHRDWFAERFPGVTLLDQGEGDLGARMDRLIHSVLGSGERHAILIGSDSPHISSERLWHAHHALDAHADLVLGPSPDGGYYLIGLTARAPSLFRDMQWSTPGVLKTTLERAAAIGLNVELLPVERDIDTPGDLAWLEDQSDYYAEVVRSTMRG